MKTLATIAAAAGLTMALAVTGALAQGSTATGTGAAPQQDKPSTAGVTNPGGAPEMNKPSMKMTKAKKSKKHRKAM